MFVQHTDIGAYIIYGADLTSHEDECLHKCFCSQTIC